jgi:hypothetical protein
MGISRCNKEVLKMKSIITKTITGLVIFAVTFLLLASVTPATGDLEVEFELTDLHSDDIDPDFIESATVGGKVELLAKDHTIVEAVDYLDRGGTIIEVLPESFIHLGLEVYWVRITISWYVPSTYIDWITFDVECHLYHDNFDDGFIAAQQRSGSYFGYFAFEDLFLHYYFDSTTAGEQTEYFKAVFIMQGEAVVDGEIGTLEKRFVEDVPVTIRVDLDPVADEDEGEPEIDDDEWERETDPYISVEDGITDSKVYEVDTDDRMDEIIYVGLDFDDQSRTLSFFGGADSPLTKVQQLMLVTGIVTIAIIIFSQVGGQKIMKDALVQLGELIPKRRW